MVNKKLIGLCFFFTLAFSGLAQAFDLEDYATTYRASRDAYLKAANELKLATGPFKAARDARIANEKVVAIANGDSAALAEAMRKESAAQSCGL